MGKPKKMVSATSHDVQWVGVRAALLDVAKANDGLLRGEKVVAVARDPAHVLHAYFEWDDGDAADAYRLAQAQALIRRVRVTVVREHADQREVTVAPVRAYVSLPSQRGEDGGYEIVEDVMAAKQKREELLRQVLRDLQHLRNKYWDLTEFANVWVALDAAADDFVDFDESAVTARVGKLDRQDITLSVAG